MVFNLKAQDKFLNNNLSVIFGGISVDSSLKVLEKEIQLYFTYNSELINGDSIVNAVFFNAPLVDILDSLFYNRSFDYRLIEKQLVIFKQAPVIKAKPENITKEQQYFQIEGSVVDFNSGMPLSFATVSVQNKSIGIACNYDGHFILKLSSAYLNDTLVINHLGYFQQKIPVVDIKDSLQIKLKQQSISLQEVIIRRNSPVSLMEQAIEKIPQNYPGTHFIQRAFYRESVKKGNRYLVYAEGLLDIFKSRVDKPTIYVDKAKLIKKRRYSDLNSSDTVSLKLRGGVNTCLTLDVIKNPQEFLIAENLDFFKFRLRDIVTYNGRPAYEIEFKPIVFLQETLFSGVVYIDVESLAFVRVKFGYSTSALRKLNKSFVVHSSRRVKAKPVSISYDVSYRAINGKYYVNHIRGELTMKVRKRRRFLKETYSTSFEMITTDVETEHVSRIKNSEIHHRNSIFSDWDNRYDVSFWNNDNFVLPEEDLSKALSRFQKGELEITD